jgi:uncharacterized FlgJ-related protein
MKTVVVLPNNRNAENYRAISGKKTSFGKTIGEAIDSINEQLKNEPNPVIFIQDFEPDEFFTAEQQQRLSELMEKLRQAQAGSYKMDAKEREELEALIDAELDGSAQRTEAMLKLLNRDYWK